MINSAFFYKCAYYIKSKKWYIIAFAIIAIVLIYCVDIFCPYEEIFSVDISSGQIRSRTVLCQFVLSEKIEDTVLSKLLQKHKMTNEIPRWRTVSHRIRGIAHGGWICYSFGRVGFPLRYLGVMLEGFPLPDETQILLAVAFQKWMESIANGDEKYENPLEINGACTFGIFFGSSEPNSTEYMIAIEKFNEYLSEQYDIDLPFHIKDTNNPENGESESPTEQ